MAKTLTVSDGAFALILASLKFTGSFAREESTEFLKRLNFKEHKVKAYSAQTCFAVAEDLETTGKCER